MALKSGYETQECSIARALEIVGERWTLLILRDCFLGVRRFTDLQRRLGLPKAVLATRLENLLAAGVLDRREYQSGRYEYLLTERGLGLWPALHALNLWGNEHLAPRGPRALYRHAGCGIDLAPGAFCPECGRTPPATEIEYRPGPARLAAPEPDDAVERALRRPRMLLEPLPPMANVARP
jgi:DNA-binding HxlR family transcriptional regulator